MIFRLSKRTNEASFISFFFKKQTRITEIKFIEKRISQS